MGKMVLGSCHDVKQVSNAYFFKHLTTTFVAVVLAFLMQAQSNIVGRVFDVQSSNGVPYANCVLLSLPDSLFLHGTVTDEQGYFHFDSVPSNAYLLRVTAIGYTPCFQIIEYTISLEPLVVGLSAEATMLSEVSIKADKPIYNADGEKMMYHVDADHSVQGGTLSDALQNAPGVEVDAEGNITLRGTGNVEVWINNRPSHMNDNALKQYIKQLPAGAIERIEVIANPSARYSSSGGVINIVTNQKVSRNELLCLGLYANTQPYIGPWLSYVWANEKIDVNVYLTAQWLQNRTFSDGTATLLNPVSGDTSRYQSHRDSILSNNYGGFAGLTLSWHVSEKTNLSTWFGFYPYKERSHTVIDVDYLEYNPMRDLGYHYDHRNDDGLFYGGYGGLWLEHRFDTTGRKLSISVSGNTLFNGGTEYSYFAYHNPSLDTLFRCKVSHVFNPSIEAEVNYSHPLKDNWEVEAGLSVSYGGGNSAESLDSLTGGQYANISLRSPEGMERSNKTDVYATMQKRWGNLTAKIGIRGEWERLQSQWQYADGSNRTEVDTSFFCPVPSIHLSYQTKTFSSYSISYTRRYDRAGTSKINPFCLYDDYSYETGNPNLKLLNFTHSFEAAWSKYIPSFGTVNISAYFRANTDEIGIMTSAGYAPAYFPPTQLVYFTYPDNIGNSHTEGVEANITYRPTAMLNVRLNGSVFNYAYDYRDNHDSKVSYSLRLNVWAKLWQKLELFATAHYTSPRLALYSMSVDNKGVNVGLNSDLFDRRVSFMFSVNDVFASSQFGDNTIAPTYQTTGSTRYNSRFVMFGVTFRMGKMELESKARQGGQMAAPVQ
ncbi:MAG: outer membrane beta-barrel protein [Bacteroidales bacterium]|nr:outer membrane beta-barrel protein [Bacteroidales bacterium]